MKDNSQKISDLKSKDINNTEIDTIIIGSGVGGLASAICLSRAGQRVLVLEQHDVPGGWCHSFYLNGYRFTPGVHYVGLLDKGQSTSELYKGLGIANDLAFFRMNTKGYEHCWIGDERFDFPANFEKLCNSLSKRFPKEKKNIVKYLAMVRTVSRQIQLIPKMKGFWDHVTIPFRTKYMGKYALFSLKKVINWYLKDPLLKTILNMQYGDHGLPPGKASFPLHCAVMDHYFDGGFYPMGGGGAIVKAMTNMIKKHGSEVRTGQNVKHILLEGKKKKRAIGVELENGEQIFAKRVISNADPGKTYLDMVGRDNISNKLSKKLDKTKYSCTSLMLFLTIDMDLRKAGLDSGNIWMMSKNEDMDKQFAEMQRIDIEQGDEFAGLFISCTTLKDPISFDGRYHTIEVITYINYQAFEKFKNEDKKRSPEYLQFKKKLTQKFINSLEKVVPGISKHIVHKELGTPITNKYYINSTNGCVYGTEKSLRHIGPFAYKPKSEIENLYLCGASIASHGVAGASYSGVQTAAIILKCRQDDLITTDANLDQDIRIYDAEDPSGYPDWMLRKMEIKKARLTNNIKIFSSNSL
ncbi:phytoene desaturase family protein [Aquimarina muelleri]|uniref:Phytoene dehydrogenase n=1 Tax=Aquimarina muelleri TaxID=279356 RepID=A0A918JXL4_9FLAO|nr:NAD(P)/FAD-dependent oxidoreductase [Aquimarina muelleri]MCX2762018.1 NAD(P)/FAD-dependent oxidoreductase [Aquimarina muelleri]GGX24986.1 phytoene dehydrogenase [Aquimarina muelleri]